MYIFHLKKWSTIFWDIKWIVEYRKFLDQWKKENIREEINKEESKSVVICEN